MGYDLQKQIVDYIRKNPGLNGGAIARGMGHDTNKVSIDIVKLRTCNVIRREGVSSNARWYVIDGAEVPEPKKRGPATVFNFKNRCAYHREHAPSGLYCVRCSIESEAPRRASTAKLKKLFPTIFSEGK